ncbi:hypothetical protein [Thalassotalea sp. ND16A]|uniref:hypothetical protein n=1 Tax=Thalassotalea sp. ND16A TaxID=1535422 RepID=UPI00051A031A|nr:hypothetical protein [Thalassotalea sp. ND16A]KGK00094.1 hypothetical protein ND16A_0285 [Thalassotalea sp. ND16A]
MKLMNKIATFMALSYTTLLTPALATLDVSQEQVYFALQDENNITVKNATVTIVNNYATPVDLTGQVAVVRDDNTTDNITYVDSTCQTSVAAGGECYVTFTYNQLEPDFQGILLEVNDASAGTKSPIFVSNYFEQSTADEAARRISPLVESVQVFASTDTGFTEPLTGALAAGDYKIRWTVLAYEDLKSTVVIDNCGLLTAPNSACAIAEDNNLDEVANSTELASTLLTTHSFTDYQYQGETTSHLQFTSADLTIPSYGDGAHLLALRFYSTSLVDTNDGLSKRISTILAGSLNFMGQGDAGYYFTDGRRLTVETP